MKKSKFTEEQIVFALKEHQQGTKVDVISFSLNSSHQNVINTIHPSKTSKMPVKRSLILHFPKSSKSGRGEQY
ncbi:hypothetical protein [Vampirovibrio sp.]|uniref:hypothetical protein n=1 Tax=Vampirovibrio sp. TaxID=2717857 RepID=UPI0035942A1A